jgi:hypothetical protein
MINWMLHRFGFALIVFSCLFFLFSSTSIAQDDSTESSLSFGRGRMYTAEGREILFTQIKFDSAAAHCTTSGTTTERTVPMDKVLRVDIQTGNNAALWALLGAAVCLPGAIVGVSGDSQSGVEVSSGTKAAIVAGVVGIGAVVGAVVGAGSKEYLTIYNEHKFIQSAVIKKSTPETSEESKVSSSD